MIYIRRALGCWTGGGRETRRKREPIYIKGTLLTLRLREERELYIYIYKS